MDRSVGARPGMAATPGSPAELANAYLDAFYSGDFARARAVVSDDFSFTGPLVQVTGADAFFQSAQGLRRIVRGHHILKQWVDGSDVCSVYDVRLETPLGTGTITMSEWHTAENGRLTEGRVLFDTAPFRALLPPTPAA